MSTVDLGAALTVEKVPVASLHTYPGNPRVGNVQVIAESLAANGQYRPIVVNTRTRQVLAGNHTLLAARSLAWETIWVSWVDADSELAARIVAVDNRSADLGGYDDTALLALLAPLPDLTGTGYTRADLEALLAEAPVEVTGDPDDAPRLAPGEPVCRLGDVWLLGPHRLTVGDGTVPGTLDRLLDGDLTVPRLLLTDPPYGVSYTGSGGKTIANDELRDGQLRALLVDAFTNAARVLAPGSPFYVFAPSNDQQTAFRAALHDAGLRLRQELVWVKSALVLGRSDYQPRHESILAGATDPNPDSDPETDPHEVALYGWTSGSRHPWHGGRKQTTVWEFPKPARCADHPTMKPVAMLEQAVRNSTSPGDVVLDLFAGSGSTLIAAHTTHRVARVVELDARYADVICRRWQTATGDLPTRATGERVSFLDGGPGG